MVDSLREQLEADLKTAMRSGNTLGRDTIRFLLSALKNAEIDKRGSLNDDEAFALLQRQAKRMNESIEQFRAGHREDLAVREEAQLAILKHYLPEELTDDELSSIAREVVTELGATSAKEMGRIMPLVIARVAKRADGKRISLAVKNALTAAGS